MDRSRILFVAILAGLLILIGCSTPVVENSVEKVNTIVSAQTDIDYKLCDEDIEQTVQSLLRDELSLIEAVKIALLTNPSLQAQLEELNIAHADLVQAGLLSNPVFAASARFPDGSPAATNTEFSIAHNFLDILVLPLRKKLAGIQLEQTQLAVAAQVLNLVSEVRSAYFLLQGTYHSLNLQKGQLDESEAAFRLAEKQYESRNINELEFISFQKAYIENEINLMKTQGQILEQRGQLCSLLGLNCQEVDWKIPQALPQPPEIQFTLEQLQAMAMSGRIDLRIARKKTEIIQEAIAMTKQGILESIDVGVDTERDTDRTVVTGPTLSIGLPIFDRKQASIARQEAQLRQSKKQAEALEQSIRLDVWSAFTQLNLKAEMAEHYRKSVVKLQQRKMQLSQSYYENMLIGSYTLLSAKREEIEAKLEYVDILSEYWLAYIRMENTVGKILTHPPDYQRPDVEKNISPE